VTRTAVKNLKAAVAETLPSDESLAERAYQLIEDAIVTMQLQPGQPISEADLSRLLGIGRTPVREAVQKLAGDGLIQVFPRRGLLIPSLSVEDMAAVIETRAPLERIIVGHAARRGLEEEREFLAKLAVLMSQAGKNGEVAAYIRQDKNIDHHVSRMSRARYAVKAVEPLKVMSRRFWYFNWRNDDLTEAVECHLRIVDAIIQANETAARTASDQLMNQLRSRLSELRPGI
jgi:DNA-binding GntR family transcriptional regulator